MVPWEPMDISALNASNNHVDLKSDKVGLFTPGNTVDDCHTTYIRMVEFRVRSENTQQNTSFNPPPSPGDLPQTRSNDRPSRVSPSYGRRITQATAECCSCIQSRLTRLRHAVVATHQSYKHDH